MNALKPDADQGIYHLVAPRWHALTFALRVGSKPQTFIPRLRTIVSEIQPGAQILIQNPAALHEAPIRIRAQ